MLARLASRSTKLATRLPAAISVRHDCHFDPAIVNSQNLTSEQVVAHLDKDIKDREHERFRWERMGIPFTQTYIAFDYGYEYCRGGGTGWAWMLAGVISLSWTSYLFFVGRYHDPYVFQRNPKADLEEYERMKERLAKEPDFWNWDERDGIAPESRAIED